MGNTVVPLALIAMLNPTDFDTLLNLARAYPAPDWREEIVQQAALYLLQGSDLPSAFADAVRYTDTMRRYERGEISLDALAADFGDTLNVSALPVPSLSEYQRNGRNHKTRGNATPRQPERDIEELGLEDELTFRSIIKNLVQRGVFTEAVDLAVDIAILPERLQRIVRNILCSAQKGELEERGYKSGELYGATQWLTQYFAVPPSR